MTTTQILSAFQELRPSQKLKVARTIQMQMGDALFEKLDKELPDIKNTNSDLAKLKTKWQNFVETLPETEPSISEEEIMKEVKAVRAKRYAERNS